MPYDEPEPDDPSMLVGVELPGSETTTREMAVAFADEFAQLGFDRRRLLALFHNPFYGAAYNAWRLLGEAEVANIVADSLAVWGRVNRTVLDTNSEDAGNDDRLVEGPQPLVDRNGFLKLLH